MAWKDDGGVKYNNLKAIDIKDLNVNFDSRNTSWDLGAMVIDFFDAGRRSRRACSQQESLRSQRPP